MSISPSTLQLLSHVRNSNWKGQEMKIPFQKFGKYEPDSNLVHLFTCGDEKLKTHLLICICLALLTILTSVCLSLCSALHPGSFGSTWLNTGVWRQKKSKPLKMFIVLQVWVNMMEYVELYLGVHWFNSWQGWVILMERNFSRFFQGQTSTPEKWK